MPLRGGVGGDPVPVCGALCARSRAWTALLHPRSAAAALFEVWNGPELPDAVLLAVLGSRKAVDAIWPGRPHG